MKVRAQKSLGSGLQTWTGRLLNRVGVEGWGGAKTGLQGPGLSLACLSISHCWSDTMGLTCRGATGWTRTTANSERVLVRSGSRSTVGRGGGRVGWRRHHGLQWLIPGQLLLRQDGTRGSGNWSTGRRVWISLTLQCVAGCPRRPPFPPAIRLLLFRFFFSWHCAWSGERASACFSNSPPGRREAGRGHTSLLCRGKRTQWSASNHRNYRMVAGVSK